MCHKRKIEFNTSQKVCLKKCMWLNQYGKDQTEFEIQMGLGSSAETRAPRFIIGSFLNYLY